MPDKLIILIVVLTSIMLTSCFSERDETQEIINNPVNIAEDVSSIPIVLSSNSHSEQGNKLKVNAALMNGVLKIDFDLKSIKNELQKEVLTSKDTFSYTLLYYQLLCNDEPIEPSYTGGEKSGLENNYIIESSLLDVNYGKQMSVELPCYRLKYLPAKSKAIIKFRVWQEFFFTERKSRTFKVNGIEKAEYYRDSLKKKIIDNVYSISIIVPEIYETAIVCDSIFLQNDKDWSPSGSDNTIWKSSYPDIYFTISDAEWHKQSDSHVESSTASFIIADTLSFYHYKPSAVFMLNVLDQDNLSRDDLLGTWKYDIGSLTNLKKYKLKFGHVDRFYFYKINRGLLN